MDAEQFVKSAHKLARRYRVTDGEDFRLKDYDPGDTAWLEREDKPRAKEALTRGIEMLAEYQEMLYAHDRWSLLLIFQAMDAAGKDGAIKHVMSGVNPQGCQVSSFKAPSAEELDHDFLWRCSRRLPERGRIGIFNRSYYEEVLVVRVHDGILQSQKLPAERLNKNIWKNRYRDIRNYERYLSNNGLVIRKFFLNLSADEQKQRFLDRIADPNKNWKFSVADAKERAHWKDYMSAYEEMIRNTSSKAAPWYVIPADNKWFTRIVVAATIIDALASLRLHFPEVSSAKRAELAEIKQLLESEES